MTRSNPKSVELHIEELVLHGFEPRDRHRIAEALQQELTRLFTDGGVPASFGEHREISRVDAGAFNVEPAESVERTGIQIGEAIYGGLRE
jgi:hypothetical protein